MNLRIFLSIFLAISAFACKEGKDSASIANQFVDAYYLEFNFDKALTFATASARIRIEKEQELAKKARSQGALNPAKVKVYYSEPEHRKMNEEMAHHTYSLETSVGTTRLTNRVLVMTAKREGAWKVIAFRELGRPGIGENTDVRPSQKPRDTLEDKVAATATTSTATEPSK